MVTATQAKTSQKLFLHSAAFVLGFGVVFTLLGMTAGLLGRTLLTYQTTIQRIGGVLLIIFGLTTMGLFFKLATWLRQSGASSGLRSALIRVCDFFNALLYTERRVRQMHEVERNYGYLSSFAVGVSFSAGWVPCIGPILASILLLAGNSATAGQGAILLAVYSAGLGIPFLLTGLAFGRAILFFRKLNRYLGVISMASGLFLILMGWLLLSDQVIWLVNQFGFLNEFVFSLEESMTGALGVSSLESGTITSFNAAPIALLAGVISFVSPCVLPLVPAYIGYLGGISLNE